jgi:hypothetical protein
VAVVLAQFKVLQMQPVEQQILVVVAAALVMILASRTELAETAAPASPFFDIPAFTLSPTPAVVLHLPLQLMVALK